MKSRWARESGALAASRALARSIARWAPTLVDASLRAIAHRPRAVLLALSAVTVAALLALVDSRTCVQDGRLRVASCRSSLEVDVSFNRILPHSGALWEIYDDFRRAFGTDEQVIVALRFRDSVYTPENIESLHRVTEALARVRHVHGTPLSLTSARHPVALEDFFPESVFIVDEIPPDLDDLERIRRDVERNPVYAGALVSEDERSAAVLIDFLSLSDREYIDGEISRQIRETAEREAGEGVEVRIAGGLHLKDAQYRAQLTGLLRSILLAILVIAIVLAASFRSARGVVLPLAAVLLALTWTLGLAAAFGPPLNLVTLLIPPLLIILGVSYSVHVVAEHTDVARERGSGAAGDPAGERSNVSYEALRRVYRPVVLTGVTTAIGFLAMLAQDIEALREFGLLALVGVLLTLLASLTFPPAVLALLPLPPREAESADRGAGAQDRLARFAGAAARFSRDWRRPVLAGTAAFFVLAVYSFQALEVGAGGIESFPEDSRIRSDFDAINARLGGASTLNVVLRSPVKGSFREPRHVHWIEQLQVWLERRPEVGSTTSIVEHLKVCSRALNQQLAIPDAPGSIGESLLVCRATLKSYITNDQAYTQVAARTSASGMEDFRHLIAGIETYLEEHVGVGDEAAAPDGGAILPSYFEARVTGNPVLTTDLVDRLVWGQVYSILGAVVLIYAVLALQFWNWRTGLVALVPNLLPIAAYFAALGITGTTLNPTTAVIAPMALGIAIDDTIHYMARFRDECRRTLNEHEAVESALRAVGRPITYTTAALCAGFLVFTSSPLQTHVQLGALGAFTLGFAWLAEFTVTPAICSGVRVISLWETLTLDLGHDPQTEMGAVFAELSTRQCRIVALLAGLEERPRGDRLMSIGDVGHDMYLIVDGQVQARVQSGDRHLCGRGEIIGDLGCFLPGGERTADVEVAEDARLLRISRQSLEHLQRRNPRIAAQVFLNLNTFQALRLKERDEALASAAQE